jgi:thiol-disulfide isomerase/thioredoxin
MKPLNFLLLLLVGLVLACQPTSAPELPTGIWHGELQLQAPAVVLPFGFEIIQTQAGLNWVIYNGEEKLVLDEVQRRGDSLIVRMPVFDSEFRLVIKPDQRLSGNWYNFSRGQDYSIPFQASHGAKNRFPVSTAPAQNLEKRWRAVFSEGEEDEYPAIGLFDMEKQRVQGTFLTETGDYRYLEGVMDGSTLKLSCFDGDHAFLFIADLGAGDSLVGTFWSGNHWEESWWAVADPGAELRDPAELTYLREGYENFSFSFPDLNGNPVSLKDDRYQDKVVIVQIMGSWCPNCLDETKLYKKWYDRYQDQGLEIIGLAFERSQGDMALARKNVQRLKDKLGLEYEILIAAAEDDKDAAGQALPMLNHVLSYPTSIFMDREGQVRKIHTGFNGPGTGVYYSRFVEEYEAFLEKLL